MQINYGELPDEELVRLANGDDSDAVDCLFERYKRLVCVWARGYFLDGGDREDVIQEGMIGLFRAVKYYKAEKQTSFRAFAALCVRRQIITAINAARRNKNIPLNTGVSLDKAIYGGDDTRALIDVLPDSRASFTQKMEAEEEISKALDAVFSMLTPLEYEVARLYLQGKSYQQISKETGWHTKRVDNALQRVKRKLRAAVEDEE